MLILCSSYRRDAPLTDVVLLYLEDLEDPRKFAAIARQPLPPAGTPTNPVDMTGDPEVTRYETVVRAARDFEGVKPVLTCPVAVSNVGPAARVLEDADVPNYPFPDQAARALAEAYADLIESVGRKAPEAQLRGVYIQRMAGKGVETILGVKRDPHFGPLLMVGLGGIYVEALKDVTFRTAPVRELVAQRMVEETRAYRLIEGFCNQPPSDLQALVECIQRLLQLAVDFPEIEELAINPLMVTRRAKAQAPWTRASI